MKDPQLASDEFSEEGSLTFNLNLSPRHLTEKFIHNIAVMDPWNKFIHNIAVMDPWNEKTLCLDSFVAD